ncbi:MAG: PH domain-containing protein [Planctomycetes bacterium]|nr:PH domain-containing protein [Planctomycetota bacterium]
MSDVVWSQHPSMRSRAGRLVLWTLIALWIASARWWLPNLVQSLPMLEPIQPWLTTIARWSWVALAIPVLLVAQAWIASRLVRYDLMADRLMISQGLILRRMDNLELYRVRDVHLELPLISRILGVGDIVLDTVDHTTPQVRLRGVRDPVKAFNRIREATEASRRKAGIAGMT